QLYDAGAVRQVNEQHAAVVPYPDNPPSQDHRAAGMFPSERPTLMGAMEQISLSGHSPAPFLGKSALKPRPPRALAGPGREPLGRPRRFPRSRPGVLPFHPLWPGGG